MNPLARIVVALVVFAYPAAPAVAPAAPAPASVSLAAPAAVDAGRCVAAQVSVQPAKPNDTVRLEEASNGGWATRDTELLDGASAATFAICEPWARIGSVLSLRAVWPVQDAESSEGISQPITIGVTEAAWMARIRRIVGTRNVGISVGEGGTVLFARNPGAAKIPASNQKLLFAMTAFDTLGSDSMLRTVAAGAPLDAGVLHGDLWILGDGDPTVGRSTMKQLAAALVSAGLTRVQGSVRGSKGGFSRDWFAPGWKRSFPREQVALPTALSFRGNESGGRHIRNPEKRAARNLTRRLRAAGVQVGGAPGAGVAPTGIVPLASVSSPPIRSLLSLVNKASWNFGAEMLGKRLGLAAAGGPGSIAKGAAAMEAWAAARGVAITAHDASGLSYRNRVSSAGVTALLGYAEGRPWGTALRTGLAAPGEGTLRRRLAGVAVRAKTGTLTRVSSLSGYVRLNRTGTWAEFSIISKGMSKRRAVRIENRIVRVLQASA